MKSPLPIPSDIMDYLRYDAETGKLYWTAFPHGGSSHLVGTEAGKTNRHGYVRVCFRRREYGAHRIVYFAVTGAQPPETVDHRDGDRTNNRFENLRPASVLQNNCNRRLNANASHKKGVKPRGTKFCAVIKLHRKRIHIGTYETEDEAHAAYVAKARELFGEFARAA